MYLSDSENLASLAVDTAAYFQKEHEDNGYIDGLIAERKEAEKALNNLVKAIERGIFSDTTQARLTELERRKKALTEAIEAEEMKRTLTKNDISIQHFFKKYKDADFDDPAVRDYILEYFVDRIYIYDDEVVITSWYGDDRREISWSDLDFEMTKSKSSKSSRACGSGPPYHAGTNQQCSYTAFFLPPNREDTNLMSVIITRNVFAIIYKVRLFDP